MSRVMNVTLKTTDYCNLACSYCYAPNTLTREVVTLEHLDAVLRALEEDFPPDQQFAFVWHGAEPMSAGLAFFRTATTRIRTVLGDRFSQVLQSNLTLLDENWLAFIADEQISLSTSIDGPASVHDLLRKDHAGHGTFARLERRIRTVIDRGIKLGAITVATTANYREGARVYETARDLGLSALRINPVLLPEGNPLLLPPEGWGQMVIAAAERWLDDDAPIVLDPLTSTAFRLVTGVGSVCDQQALCYDGLVGIGTDGGLYPCNRFIGVDSMKLGQLGEQRISQLPILDISHKVEQRWETIPKCRGCDIRDVCRGGCMFHAHAIYGDAFREDYFCQSYVAMNSFVIANLAKILPRVPDMPHETDLNQLARAFAAI